MSENPYGNSIGIGMYPLIHTEAKKFQLLSNPSMSAMFVPNISQF